MLCPNHRPLFVFFCFVHLKFHSHLHSRFPPPPLCCASKWENCVCDSGRVIRRAVKRRHAHPLVSRLEKDYLNSPTYHRSSPNLYQPNDVVAGVGAAVASGVSRSALVLTFF